MAWLSIITVLALGSGALLRNSPLLYQTMPPETDQPWADQPMRLVPTPQFQSTKASSSMRFAQFDADG